VSFGFVVKALIFAFDDRRLGARPSPSLRPTLVWGMDAAVVGPARKRIVILRSPCLA
jgi:hypothetical protein